MAIKTTVGVVIACNNGTAYNNIGYVDEFNVEPGEPEKIDATALGASAKTTLNGFSDYGTLTLTLFWSGDDTQHVFLAAEAAAKNNVPFKVYLPSGFGKSTIVYNVALGQFAPKFPKNDMIRAEVRGNLNGEPVIA